jgi:trimeric autotransporter adhesin
VHAHGGNNNGDKDMKLRAHFEILKGLSLVLGLLMFAVTSTGQNINTVVGGGSAGGTAKSAFIAYPGSTVKDKTGNTYISSNWGHYIFKLDTAGKVSVFAGLGYAGFSGDGGPASSAALNTPAGMAMDSAGDLYFADAGNNRIRRVDGTTGVITTVAGNSIPNMFNTGGYGGHGGPATQAYLNSPYTVAVDSRGNLFIADYLNFRIRRVDAKSQYITTVAGTGTAGYNGDKQLATKAEINYAITVIVDKADNLCISDSGNNRIRRVDAKTQFITTVAGDGTAGFKGDGGPATKAELSFPNGVTEDAAKNLYIVDTGNNRVRLVSAKTQEIKTIVGTGIAGFKGDGGPATKAEITDSSGGYIDASGNLLIADSGNQRVRIVNKKGVINTLAGGGNAGDKGKATNALLSYPGSLAFDNAGNMYVAEEGTPVIRKVSTGGTITTVAGSGSEGFSGDGGPATKAEFFLINGVAVDSSGNLFLSDYVNLRVRRVDHTTHKVSTYAGDGKSCSSPPCGDGGPATKASLSSVFSLAADQAGNLYIADPYDQVIRKVDVTTQTISTVAGDYVQCSSGTSPCGDGGAATGANLSYPCGVAVDSAGNIFIADTVDNRIRWVNTSGTINEFAFTGAFNFSGDGGPGVDATMAWPLAVAVDANDNVFVAGGYNMPLRLGVGIEVVREVYSSNGYVNTVAGQDTNYLTFGFSGDGGPATSALLNNLGIAVDSAGNLYIADSGNDRIREVALAGATRLHVGD